MIKYFRKTVEFPTKNAWGADTQVTPPQPVKKSPARHSKPKVVNSNAKVINGDVKVTNGDVEVANGDLGGEEYPVTEDESRMNTGDTGDYSNYDNSKFF